MKTIKLLVLAFIAAMFVAAPFLLRAQGMRPTKSFGVRRVSSINTTSANSITSLTGLVCSCSVVVMNNSATQLNVGGCGEVDNSTKFTSVCSTGCDTVGPITVTGTGEGICLRGAGATFASTAVIWCGGGC